MNPWTLYMEQRQLEGLRSLSEQTGEPASQWVRRMVDFCFRPEVVCQLLPLSMSGKVEVKENGKGVLP